MREIKFRAWDKKIRKWKGIWIFRGGHISEQSHYDKPDIFHLDKSFGDDIIFMQYTQFKDNGGKEIYEGDIIQGFQTERAFIILENGTFSLIFFNKEMKAIAEFAEVPHISTALGTHIQGMNGKYTKVIGNIYENPDLLKGG